MAAVVPPTKVNVSISNPLFMISSKRTGANPTLSSASASSSRLDPSSHFSAPAVSDAQPTTFKRFRTSLEHTLRTATKSKAKFPAGSDELGTLARSESKGKEKALDGDVQNPRERTKSRMLSKVSFRRPAGEDGNFSSATPRPVAGELKPGERVEKDRDKGKARVAGHTSFLTPSLRQASMSTPALHLSSQAIPSAYTQPFAIPAASSSNVSALVSPTRERHRKPNVQPPTSPKEISGPLPLTSKREHRSNGHTPASSPTSPALDQRSPKGRPPPLVLSSSSLNTGPQSPRGGSASPAPPDTPRRTRESTRSPDLSSPSPTPRGIGASPYRRGTASASHLPLSSTPEPSTPRARSPTLARSPSRTPNHRAGPSASASHLPLTPSTPTARHPSIDSQRRGGPSPSPTPSRAASPTGPTRSRAISPAQRNYSPSYSRTGGFNASSTSLVSPANPEQRELIRSAASFLCKEMLKPPSQLSKASLLPKEWEEVEVRMRALARLERVWGKSGVGMGSTSQLGGPSSSGLSAGGEERERRLFCEAIRDGYVLCHLVNKLFPNTISRIDRREDGFVRTSNVTKFLAGCSTVGLRSDDLFDRDDLLEATSEGLARVAKTILALCRASEFPAVDPSKVVQGGPSLASNSPYNAASESRAAASTPNLTALQRSTSPSGTLGARRRWSPPQPSLPTVLSDSPGEDGSDHSSDGKTIHNGGSVVPDNDTRGSAECDLDEVPPIVGPPPRSPLRPRPSIDRSSMADSTRASIGDSVRVSFADSVTPSPVTPVRQSQASSMTDSTMFSSLLEVQRSTSSGHNKFGTMRTMTTEATSIYPSNAPSLTHKEADAVAAALAEEQTIKRVFESNNRPSRERRPSGTAHVDLSRVVEEADESGSSSKGGRQRDQSADNARKQDIGQAQKAIPIKLGKGKWPDDFLDAFRSQTNSSALDDDDFFETPSHTPSHTPLSATPPRKLALVGASRASESVDSLPQFPRRPTHRARHSVDTPGLLPKDSVFIRDSSPDTGSPGRRVMLRRNSTKTALHRNGIYIPRTDELSRTPEDSDSMVPFPRAVSSENATPPRDRPDALSPPNGALDALKPIENSSQDRPRQPRGRFQSEVDGSSSRRKPRPESYDELGAKPRRSRFESMINLGAASGNASASDLLSRDSYEGSAVRQTLIVREDGKPATQFQLGNCIGRGQFGAVYRALNLNTGQMVAVKRIRLEGLKEDEIAQLMKEVDLVKSLSHPSIVKYEGMARDDNTLSIVLEYAENGSLGQTLKAFGKLNERLVASYVVKILEGLHYLHQSDVVHCDLKAANILTTKTGNVKLSDFGVSLNMRAMEREMKDVAGTPNWMAPEVIELKGASPKSDIWSLACTVIELLTGRPPYADIANSMSVMFRIVEDDMPPLPETCSDSLRDFLIQCFNKDPSMRPSAELLFEHEWLQKNWPAHKDLRPQDSIPFLRRVSADFQKSEAVRFLANMEFPDSDRSTPDHRPRLESIMTASPPRRRMSNDPEPHSPREHSFVKTTFGKPVVCRVCLQTVKKSAVLCEQCSLIAHVKCATSAPPTCDLRAQLLLYAQYAENGTPPSGQGDILTSPPTAPSATSDGNLSPRPSLDQLQPQLSTQPSPVHPPTAFKVFGAFKRSRSSLTNVPDQSSAAPSTVPDNVHHIPRKRSILMRRPTLKERPRSISSESTTPHSSSMRSAATATESFSSRTARVSTISISEVDAPSHASGGDVVSSRLSRMTSMSAVSVAGTEHQHIPGDISREKRRDRDSKGNGCNLQ